MSGKIQIVGPDEVEAVSEYDGLIMQRDLASKATGSTRMKFIHDVIVDGAEFEDAVYEDQDQVAYIISGEMELIHDGQTRPRPRPLLLRAPGNRLRRKGYRQAIGGHRSLRTERLRFDSRRWSPHCADIQDGSVSRGRTISDRRLRSIGISRR